MLPYYLKTVKRYFRVTAARELYNPALKVPINEGIL